jgi:hypothetical protein
MLLSTTSDSYLVKYHAGLIPAQGSLCRIRPKLWRCDFANYTDRVQSSLFLKHASYSSLYCPGNCRVNLRLFCALVLRNFLRMTRETRKSKIGLRAWILMRSLRGLRKLKVNLLRWDQMGRSYSVGLRYPSSLKHASLSQSKHLLDSLKINCYKCLFLFDSIGVGFSPTLLVVSHLRVEVSCYYTINRSWQTGWVLS